MIYFRGSDAYKEFRTALLENYPELVETLDNTIPSVVHGSKKKVDRGAKNFKFLHRNRNYKISGLRMAGLNLQLLPNFECSAP